MNWIGKWLFTALMDYVVSFFAKLAAAAKTKKEQEKIDETNNKKLDESVAGEDKAKKARAAEDVWNG